MVVAKGTDELALQIRQLALHHGVAQFEAPPLARAVYYTTEVEETIPEALFFPVAQVIAYVFKLRLPYVMGRFEGLALKCLRAIDSPLMVKKRVAR